MEDWWARGHEFKSSSHLNFFSYFFLKIYSEDFNDVKEYILRKKFKKKKKNWITGKIAFKLYGQILFIGKTYFMILPRKFIGNT